MNKRYLLFCLLLTFPFEGLPQSKRPQVLVYGHGVDAYAAALQSARSNLNTVWVINGDRMMPELTSDFISITSNTNLDAGIWATLLARTLQKDKPTDSLSAVAKRRINPRMVQNVIDSVVKATKNLTIIEEGQLRAVKKSGKSWQIELSDRTRLKVRAVVDASSDAYVYLLAYGSLDSIEVRNDIPADYFQFPTYDGLSRSGVAVGDVEGRGFTLPLAALVPAGDNNLFVTRRGPVVGRLLSGTADDVPLLMHVGQAVGAAAGYTAFYKITSDKLDARNVQGELLQYGARLLPFVDVPIEGPHFAAIQRVGATGILLGREEEGGRLYFDADTVVTADEMKNVLNALFSRSQIWFINHADIDILTLADLLSFIKFVGQRGDEMEAYVEKNWKRRFQLAGVYDKEQQVTRRQVAVLLDAYCKPFDVKIGLDGNIQR